MWRKAQEIEGPITFRWHPDLLWRLSEQISNEPSAEDQLKERGGLLLGTVERTGKWPQITPQLFMPIACSHQAGPHYHLSEADQASLGRSLALVRPYWTCIGFYRGHLRPSLELDEKDLLLARKYLTYPFSIFLLVNAKTEDGPHARLFGFNGHEFSRDPSLLQLRSSLPGELGPAHDGGQGALVSKRYSELSVQFPPIQNVRKKIAAFTNVSGFAGALSTKWPRVWLTGALILILILFVGVLGRAILHTQKSNVEVRDTARHQSTLDLKTSVERDHVLISWSPYQPLAGGATSGMLSVTDGSVHKTIALDKDSLSHGSAVYYPSGDMATFELRIGGVTQSLVAAGLSAVPKGNRQPTQLLDVAGPHRRLANALDGSGTRNREAADLVKDSEQRLDLRKFPALGAESRKLAMYVAPPTYRPVLAAPELLQPPDPGIAGSAATATAVHFPLILPSTPPMPQPGEAVPIQRVDFSAARAIKHVSPRVSLSATGLLVSRITIRVQVSIDARGKVFRVDALSRGNNQIDYLARLSTAAAREWVFSPARRDGRNVESVQVLEFSFDRTGVVQAP